MNIKLFTKGVLFALAAVSTGCSDKESSEYSLSEPEQLRLVRNALAEVPEEVSKNETIPVWLSEFIDSLEPDNARNVAAYQAQWKGEVVYYVRDDYFSCIMCTTFKSDGERFDWSKIDPTEFWVSATDWKCIYLSEFKIKDL